MPAAADLVDRGSRGSRVALAGIVFAVLLGVAWFLFRASPPFDATQAEIAQFAASPGRQAAARFGALYVVPLTAIAFMWFAAALRDRVVRGGREDQVLSTVHLMAATLFVMALFLMGALELALVWQVQAGEADPGVVGLNLSIGRAASELIALRTSAVFVMISTTRALRSGIFPRWFGVVSVILGLALLLVGLRGNFALYTFPAWVTATSLLIVFRRVDPDEPTPA